MVKRAFISMLMLIALLGLSSIAAFGLAEDEELDQADDQASDLKSIQLEMDGKPGDVYQTIVLIGTSKHSWEKAVMNAFCRAYEMCLKDLTIVEIKELDTQLVRPPVPYNPQLPNGEIEYRATVEFSFKPEMHHPISKRAERTERGH